MESQLYMTRQIMVELPPNLQAQMWQMVIRREQVNAHDYLHIFNVNFQKQHVVITHTQEIPVFKCTTEIKCNSNINTQYKIYVIREDSPDKKPIYTMLFANEY